MFGESFEGKIHQLLNNENFDLNKKEGSKFYALVMIFCFNDQLCQQFCLRKSGTNYYLYLLYY